MSRPPDFDELVGTPLAAAERERLLRVHELLIEAGPPPDLGTEPTGVPLRRLRRRAALVALAAALGLGLFAAGWMVGGSGDPGTFEVITMTGTAYTAGLSATITILPFQVNDERSSSEMPSHSAGIGRSAICVHALVAGL